MDPRHDSLGRQTDKFIVDAPCRLRPGPQFSAKPQLRSVPGTAALRPKSQYLGPAAQADETELAKQTQNPVADLISMPFQFNFNTGGDLADQTLFNLNFQPVIPFSVATDWNVIARAIVPFLDVPVGLSSETGLGDIQAQFFFTPKRAGAFVWGAGPVFSFPTATNPFARSSGSRAPQWCTSAVRLSRRAS